MRAVSSIHVGLLALACGVVVSGCGPRVVIDGASDKPPTFTYPLWKKVDDATNRWDFSPDKPFYLEFGRGSGMDGLDLVRVEESGQATLFRPIYDRTNSAWKRAELRLSEKTLRRIAELVRRLKITQMDKAYHANVRDGSQWVFWLKQDAREKAIYFDNHFPETIVTFANELDAVLESEGFKTVQWSTVPKEKWRGHETAIWEIIDK